MIAKIYNRAEQTVLGYVALLKAQICTNVFILVHRYLVFIKHPYMLGDIN